MRKRVPANAVELFVFAAPNPKVKAAEFTRMSESLETV